MTEDEWLSCTDPILMLDLLRSAGQTCDRKLRLLAVACSRRIWHLIDDLGRAAIEVAEQFAEGHASAEVLRAARLACKSSGNNSAWYAAASDPFIAARDAILSAQSAGDSRTEQAKLVREIFGNPFRACEPASSPCQAPPGYWE